MDSTEVDNEDINLENQIDLTVLFPDPSRPIPTNGGFENQEEFRTFLANNPEYDWRCLLQVRPHNEIIHDFKDDNITLAFPLQFPYGFSGFSGDDIFRKNEASSKIEKSRNRLETIRKLLRHRKPSFHTAMFNLVAESTVMKDIVFQSAKLYCSMPFSEAEKLGEMFGKMTPSQIENEIQSIRNNESTQ